MGFSQSRAAVDVERIEVFTRCLRNRLCRGVNKFVGFALYKGFKGIAVVQHHGGLFVGVGHFVERIGRAAVYDHDEIDKSYVCGDDGLSDEFLKRTRNDLCGELRFRLQYDFAVDNVHGRQILYKRVE